MRGVGRRGLVGGPAGAYRRSVSGQDRRSRARAAVDRLAVAGHDTVRFWQESTEVLRSVVPFDAEPCWFTVDPEHLVLTGHFNAGLRETPPEIVLGQYAEQDVHTFAELARRRLPAATVHAATRGQPAASWRWGHLLAPRGFDDALDAVLRVRGSTWGAVSLLRSADRPPFSEADVQLLGRLSPALATGTRLGLLVARATGTPPSGPRSPAVLVVSAGLLLVSATPTADDWLADLPDSTSTARGRLPAAVQVAVVRAASAADGEATLRLRARSGAWVRVHAAVLAGGADARFAVVVESAPPGLLAPLLLLAAELTAGERQVVDLVLRGRSTAEIARALVLSPYTVQDRLKVVFDKLGVRSRRELVAHVNGAQAWSHLFPAAPGDYAARMPSR